MMPRRADTRLPPGGHEVGDRPAFDKIRTKPFYPPVNYASEMKCLKLKEYPSSPSMHDPDDRPALFPATELSTPCPPSTLTYTHEIAPCLATPFHQQLSTTVVLTLVPHANKLYRLGLAARGNSETLMKQLTLNTFVWMH